MMYGLAALSVGVWSIPLLFILWRVVKTPLRTWTPVLILLGLIVLIQGVGRLIGPDGWIGLIYILAGAKK